jgi:DNA-binding response OmpR family regulator
MKDVQDMTPDTAEAVVKGPNQEITRAANRVLRVDDLEMDLDARVVKRGKVQIRLNRKEFAFLEYLMRNSGIALTRDMILARVWDIEFSPSTNTVDVHVRFLRKKIDDGRRKKLIQTVHGYGYKMAV